MPKKNKIRLEVEPIGKRIFLDGPKNGLDALKGSGIDIKSLCAGRGACGKCRIMILDGLTAPVSRQEERKLTPDEIKKGVRLACQQTFDKDLNIYIPASSLSEEQKLQVTGTEKDIRPEPVCKKYYIELGQASLEDLAPDFERIKEALKGHLKAERIDFKLLGRLPDVLRENGWKVTVTVRDGEVINIEGGDRSGKDYGIAIDLGTTKIALLLVELGSGKTIGSKGIINPQISFGEDVMSRLHFANSGDGLRKIQKVVIEAVDEAIGQLCEQYGLSPSEVSEATLVGNTAMHHLFLGLPVKQLSLSPFVSIVGHALEVKARELGISICTGGYVYMPPPIAGFVGSDHLAMVLAADLEDLGGNTIGIDIGTNTEIALKTDHTITSVSTASGPAFEGAHIRCGMRAAPGAIERVIIEPDSCRPIIQTIGDKRASGICGSGILDTIAELRKAQIIDDRGKFNKDSKCICKDQNGDYQYILVKKDGAGEPCEADISIGQADIVEIQLAKGAMRAGIEVLLDDAGLDFKQIDKIIIAGAFGSYIDPKNVINIGMFPNVSLKKIIQVGNAAGVGSKRVLISARERKKAERLAKKIKYLEVTVHPQFQDHFANSLKFPTPEEII